MLSLVLPTYNEAGAIQEALRRAASALRHSGEDFELIVVDDSSPDGTAELAQALSAQLPVRILSRPGRQGLATAVVDGWSIARGDLLGVMDADLQHPPEVLEDLVGALHGAGADLAIASRYVLGGDSPDWNLPRRWMSQAAAHLAASVMPWTFARVKDPMSGMFLVRAELLKDIRLRPLGYKILLEVLARTPAAKLVEVPYVFEPRGGGSSKLGARQFLEYLAHLARLAQATGQVAGWVRYGLVGVLGAVVDIGLIDFFAARLGWPLFVAVPLAIELALLSNFFWHDIGTFRFPRAGAFRYPRLASRLLRYEKVCLAGAVLNFFVTLVLAGWNVPLLWAAAAGVVAGGVWNFLFNLPGIWQTWSSLPAAAEMGSSLPKSVKEVKCL